MSPSFNPADGEAHMVATTVSPAELTVNVEGLTGKRTPLTAKKDPESIVYEAELVDCTYIVTVQDSPITTPETIRFAGKA